MEQVFCVPAIYSDSNMNCNSSRLCNHLTLEQTPGNTLKSAEGNYPSQQSSQRHWLLSESEHVTWLHSWTHSPPKAHEVSMAMLGKLLKGALHMLLKLLGHNSPSTITLSRHCCYVWQSNRRAGVGHDLLYLGKRKWAILKKVTRGLFKKWRHHI